MKNKIVNLKNFELGSHILAVVIFVASAITFLLVGIVRLLAEVGFKILAGFFGFVVCLYILFVVISLLGYLYKESL